MSETQDGKVFGLIGCPLKHSLSPKMHNAAFAEAGIDAYYAKFEIAAGDVESALKGMKSLGIGGFNVTVPYKEAVRPYLDAESDGAVEIGAVNTIVNNGGKLEGHNTDAFGFAESLRIAGFDARGKRALVLGAGGAARAVVYALAKEGTAEIAIANRKIEIDMAHRMAEHFSGLEANLHVLLLEDTGKAENFECADLIVNCTTLGLKPGDPMPVDKPAFHKGQTVLDLVYNPIVTPFLQAAQRAGAGTATGLGMLVLQARESFRLWTGVNHDPDVFERPLRQVNPEWRITRKS